MIRTLLTPMVVFACAFMVSLSHGITNIESTRLNNTQEGTTGNVSLSLDGRIGSSDKVALGTSAKLIRAYNHDEWIALISRDYAEVDGEVNTDESLIHLRYLTKHSPHWGHEVFTQYQEDKFSFLAKRSLLGAGGRYTLSSEHPLQQANNIGLGLFYEVEGYTNTSTKNENNVRLNLYWAYKNKVHDNILYTSTLYFQPDTDQLSDQKGLWQNALTISVTSTVSLNLSWDMEHDTRTPNGANNTETSYNSVLIYNF